MTQWSNCKLRDLLDVKHGYAFLGEYFGTAGSHIVVTPGSFYDEGGFKDKGEKEKWYSGPVPGDYILSAGDLIIAMTEQAEGLLGSGALIPCNDIYLHNQRIGLIQIRDPKKIDKRFLYYTFNSTPVRQQIRASASGTKIRHTAPSRIGDVTVCIPPLPVQKRIASILSAYDELIENSQRRIRILETMARSLYREWFVHFRFPGHEKVPLVPSTLGKIPKGWECRTVADIVKRVPAGNRYDQKSVSTVGNIPVLDQGKSGIIGYHDDLPGVFASEHSPVIVFANHTCYQRMIQFPFSAIQNVLPFVPSDKLHRDIYWLHFATFGLVKFNDYKGHWPELVAKTVIVPQSDLCQKFGIFAKSVLSKILQLDRQVQNLRRTRDLLLPRLLSGQVDVGQT